MKSSAIFNLWAPPEAIWSQWVKPVLFACREETQPPLSNLAVPFDTAWSPSDRDNSALILDLPGALGVTVGLALAAQGYRPVPLYNAVPGPTSSLLSSNVSIVNVLPIMDELVRGTEVLRQLKLPPAAPPAFLLDANRRIGEGAPSPGRFDNRSISFVTDFPSANFLLAQNIRQVILVQTNDSQPQPDLAHTLLRWQEAGIVINVKALDASGAPVPCTVTKPPLFRRFWYSLLASAGLRRNELGGFGGLIPIPSAG